MTASGPPLDDGDGPGDALAVWLLALGQTLGYAAFYYSFGALIVALEAGTGWSKAQLSLGPALTLVVSALAAPLAGRLVDAGHGARLLWGGAAFGGLALAGLSTSSALPVYLLFWALVGLAHAASLYEVCFAFLTRRLGAAAPAAIVRVTVLAGFASALAFPLGTGVAELAGWRGAVLVFAVLMIGVAAPVNWVAGARLRRRARVGSGAAAPEPGALKAALRRAEFWILAVIFGLAWMNHTVVMTFIIPVLTDLGASKALAVATAATVGPSQVAARTLLMLGGARVAAQRAVLWSLAAMAAASAVLLAAGAALWLVFLFAMLQGGSIGLVSALRPVLCAEVLGRRGFGAITGVIAMSPLLSTAAAPVVGALILRAGGSAALIAATCAMGAAATVLALVLRARIRRV